MNDEEIMRREAAAAKQYQDWADREAAKGNAAKAEHWNTVASGIQNRSAGRASGGGGGTSSGGRGCGAGAVLMLALATGVPVGVWEMWGYLA